MLPFLIFLIAIGGMIGIITNAGGVAAIGDYIARKARSVKTTQFATWLMGIAIFFDDYANSLIVGNTMRPITDRMKISREKLAYIVDATAAPITSMALVSTWVAYEMGLIKDALDKINLDTNVYTIFIKSIPYRFYSIFALVLVLIIILMQKDFGPMFKAEVRARKTGKVLRDGAVPMVAKELTDMEIAENKDLDWFIDAFLPIISVIVITLVGLWYNGGGPSGLTIRQAFGNADASVALVWASFGGSIIAGIIALLRGSLSISGVVKGWVEGAKSMVFATFILVLAWSLNSVTDGLGTANYLVGITREVISPFLVPLIVFIVSAFIAFATGTSWGTNAVVMPLAVPLAYSLGIPFVPTIGAVLTGAVVGDHCSPISDTTIMSSTASGSDHLDHVKTQLPYALTGALVAGLFGFIPAGLGVSAYISLPLGVVALILIVYFFGKSVKEEDIEDLVLEE